jgi:hypothetical protein
MDIVYLLLYLAACVCFGLASTDRPALKVNLIALGLLFFAAVPTLQLLIGFE